uniref:RNA helicase n=1 Tax=Panagrolaimus superbus TaxID=310955 RepID=A0A914Z7K2_9BILA
MQRIRNKGHPYNDLMKEYHRYKYGDSDFQIRTMPQVIGLTASLGSPKNPKNVDDVIKYMINKCANFDAKSYTIVTKNAAELYLKISKTKENTIVVKNDDEFANKYYNYLRGLIEDIEIYLMGIDGVLRNPAIFEGHCEIKKAEYKTWLAITRQSTLKKSKLSPLSKMKATDCLDYLDQLYEAYQCAQLFPTADTTEFYLKNLGSNEGTDLDKLVYRRKQKLGKDPCSECDIFKKLVKCINDQFKKNADSKIIIFTPQRYYCRLGAEVIERYTGKKGIFISGSNASSDEGGCNPAQQSEIVKKFRNGETQILFATTVVDEGFDIAECNLVIKYNLVTDNIAHLQRKGRARQLLSESILITFEEKKKMLEEKNMANIQMITEAYQCLEKLSTARKLSMFENAIIEYNQKRVEEENRDATLKQKMSLRNADFTILCGKCDAYITASANIRLCGSYYIPYDPELWKIVEFCPSTPEADRYNKEKRLGILGMIHCNNVVNGQICDKRIGCATNF